jgi:NAD(P)-dependent dehydrogenase (short-subunit alcohol dehydrogenase family)
VSVNDAFRPVARFFDRITRPGQLLTALPAAVRVLVDPVQASAAAVISAYGRVDCLVNSAGLTSRGTLLDTPELFDQHIAVNLRAPFFLMQAVVADMLTRQSPGTIVNIISTSEHCGQAYMAPHVTAKADVASLTRNVAHAHCFDRIRISGLNIGWTATEGEDATQRAFHGAGDDWRKQAAIALPSEHPHRSQKGEA